MSLAHQFHAEHKARLARLGAPSPYQAPVRRLQPRPIPNPVEAKPVVPVLNPAFYYPNMWFWELIALPAKPDLGGVPTMRRILRAVAVRFSISLEDMFSSRRTVDVARPRQVAMYLAKKLTHLSLPAIGRLIGDRDHTTVIHGVKKIESILLVSPEMQVHVTELIEELKRS